MTTQNHFTRRRALHLGAAAALMLALPVRAQREKGSDTYPSRPMRMIVPFAPAGGTDLTGRAIAQKLTEAWGQPVVVENKPGANGTIGADLIAKAPPDGYTIGMISSSHSVNVSLYKTLPYDLLRDLTPITQATTQPYVLVVNPKLPVKSVAELIALAKTKPGALNYGSSGTGGLSHLSGALLATLAKIELTHVPYKGGAPAMADVIGGQIDMLFSTILQSHAHIEAGRLRPLAVTTPRRNPAEPDWPTMQEAGVPGYEVAGWYGVVAPAGLPRSIVTRLNAEIVRILQLPEVRTHLASDGSDPVGSTPEQFEAHIRSEVAKWRDLVREAHITAE